MNIPRYHNHPRNQIPLSLITNLKRHQEEAIGGVSIPELKRLRRQLEQYAELNDLPVEILFEILSRLPLKYLLQAAKYTCKLWNNITKDSLFPELHVARTSKILVTCTRFTGYHNLFADKPHSDAIVGMKLCGDLGGDNYTDIQSSAGLICYRALHEKSIYICNPITWDRVKIPSENVGREVDFGFGYAHLSKKYNYFQVSHGLQPNPRLSAAILTLRFPISNSPFYSDGALYWVASTVFCMDEIEYQVVSPDLETERFRAMRILPIGTSRNFKGCLGSKRMRGRQKVDWAEAVKHTTHHL
ncbi:hypothetical protein IFM89_024680 [Coptis chinensis]|uniref:F-box domain-containing protein n=1 Tax=Coptis chinensis TaxID=261450 RepID=A0A835IDI4_9MAGN|nr:hypothetical protein IFM89_024680 [Coptis chinensis]